MNILLRSLLLLTFRIYYVLFFLYNYFWAHRLWKSWIILNHVFITNNWLFDKMLDCKLEGYFLILFSCIHTLFIQTTRLFVHSRGGVTKGMLIFYLIFYIVVDDIIILFLHFIILPHILFYLILLCFLLLEWIRMRSLCCIFIICFYSTSNNRYRRFLTKMI